MSGVGPPGVAERPRGFDVETLLGVRKAMARGSACILARKIFVRRSNVGSAARQSRDEGASLPEFYH